MTETQKIAVITGASAGIGAATATALARDGYRLILGARREERLRKVAEPLGAEARALDVSDPASIERFVAGLERVDVLVNNAGGARHMDRLESAQDEDWEWMWRVNVLGLMRVTRALLPALRAAPHGHIVNLGSTSGFEVYRGGAGYTSVKWGVRAISRSLRLELLGEAIRITEIAPGMVETEFSLARFDGNAARAAKTYEGLTPLIAEDVAEAIAWAVGRPPHVNVDEIVLRPVAQATATEVHRN